MILGSRRGAEVYRTKIASIVAVVSVAQREPRISDKSKRAGVIVDADTLHTSSPAITLVGGHSYYNNKMGGAGGVGGGGRQAEDVISAVSTRLVNKIPSSLYRGVRCCNAAWILPPRRIDSPEVFGHPGHPEPDFQELARERRQWPSNRFFLNPPEKISRESDTRE